MHSLLSRPISCQHRHVSSSPSTNSELISSLKAGQLDSNLSHMLTADIQTSGRGQHGRSWQSPEGNVYLSLYYPMHTPLSGLLSLVIGYHLTQLPIIQKINQAYRRQNLPTIGVKWANDIGFYDTCAQSNSNKLMFNKLAGILIEPVLEDNHLLGVVIGVGLNVNNVPVLNAITLEGMDYQAIGLNELLLASQTFKEPTNQSQPHLLDQPLKPSDLYLPINSSLIQAIKRFNGFNIDPYSVHRFMSDFANVNVLAKQNVSIKQQALSTIDSNKTKQAKVQKPSEQSVIKGEVLGINPNGSLKLSQSNDNGTTDIYTGTITVRPARTLNYRTDA